MFKIKLLRCQWAESFFFFFTFVYFNLWRPFTTSLKGDRLIDSLIWCLAKCKFSSVAQSCLTLCDPMDCRTPCLPVHHQLPAFTQTHVHRVSDAIQSSHPLSSLSPSPPAFNLSQHQGLCQWVSSRQVAKVLEVKCRQDTNLNGNNCLPSCVDGYQDMHVREEEAKCRAVCCAFCHNLTTTSSYYSSWPWKDEGSQSSTNSKWGVGPALRGERVHFERVGQAFQGSSGKPLLGLCCDDHIFSLLFNFCTLRVHKFP